MNVYRDRICDRLRIDAWLNSCSNWVLMPWHNARPPNSNVQSFSIAYYTNYIVNFTNSTTFSLVIRFRCEAKEAQCPLGDKFGCDAENDATSLMLLAKSLNLKVYIQKMNKSIDRTHFIRKNTLIFRLLVLVSMLVPAAMIYPPMIVLLLWPKISSNLVHCSAMTWIYLILAVDFRAVMIRNSKRSVYVVSGITWLIYISTSPYHM